MSRSQNHFQSETKKVQLVFPLQMSTKVRIWDFLLLNILKSMDASGSCTDGVAEMSTELTVLKSSKVSNKCIYYYLS